MFKILPLNGDEAKRLLGARYASAILDVLIVVSTLWVALALRFDGEGIPSHFFERMLLLAPLTGLIVAGIGVFCGLHASIPRYAGLREMWTLGKLVGFAAFLLVAFGETFYLISGERALPLSVPVIWAPICFLAMSVPRLMPRMSSHMSQRKDGQLGADRVLIVGAGDAGEHVVRDMLRAESALIPVGFLDDDVRKIGRRIHGLRVFGPIDTLVAAVAQTNAHRAVIALPNASSQIVRSIVKLAEQAGVRAQILPTLAELMGEQPTVADVRDVDIGDLIGRYPVKVNAEEIARILESKSVLVTGAAGSIGSELARQALRFNPKRLALLDTNETDLYLLYQRLGSIARSRGCDLQLVVGDIRDRHCIDLVFEEHAPDLVLHAAAYKHVNVMELHPGEAVKTNVLGTRNLAEAACQKGVERFILVSTDKAVNPSSVMGASKRAAEVVLSQVSCGSLTAFAAVRFGNVLGSRGSVVPIIAEQIRNGGPITVSHEDATRYFMTIEEAVSLILQAGAIAEGGETFVLEMGEPVRIMDLARRMRDLLGDATTKDKIEIVITGLRPGEKMHEDLWQDGEVVQDGMQPGIQKVAASADLRPSDVIKVAVSELERAAYNLCSKQQIASALFDFVRGGGSGGIGPSDPGSAQPLVHETRESGS